MSLETGANLERNDSIALINAVIYTMASPGRVQALFARGGVIRALGRDKEILSMCDAKTVVLDMKGKAVFPGFTDTHNHLLATGRHLETPSLGGIRSISEMIAKGRVFLENASMPDGEWFFARGWNQDHLIEKRFPNRYDLDNISPSVPIVLERYCGHIAVMNSRALEILRIGPGFKIPGGVVQADDSGEPTGVISEAAVNWVRMNIPEYSEAAIRRWYKLATGEMVRYGITSAQCDDIKIAGSPERIFKLYEAIEAEGGMSLRITEQWHLRDEKGLAEFIENGWHNRNGQYFKSGPLKIHVDGTLGARTAALREEYSDDPGNRGIYAHSQSELNRLVSQARRAGMSVAFYAIGDGAIERCLNSVEETPGPSGAYRIVHCQVGAPDLYRRMASLGVMADIQPAFVISDWPIVVPRLGADRARWSYAWKTLSRMGIIIGAGSDAPTEPLNPFLGIRAAVARRDVNNKPEHGWMPAERLDLVEALSLYTAGGARICGELGWRGTLEAGKAADITAFMQDPLRVNEDDLLDVKVGLTIVDGRIRYIE